MKGREEGAKQYVLLRERELSREMREAEREAETYREGGWRGSWRFIPRIGSYSYGAERPQICSWQARDPGELVLSSSPSNPKAEN